MITYDVSGVVDSKKRVRCILDPVGCECDFTYCLDTIDFEVITRMDRLNDFRDRIGYHANRSQRL